MSINILSFPGGKTWHDKRGASGLKLQSAEKVASLQQKDLISSQFLFLVSLSFIFQVDNCRIKQQNPPSAALVNVELPQTTRAPKQI